MVQIVDNLVEREFPRIRRRPLLAYPIAAAIFILAAALRALLATWLPPSLPFLTFFIAVLLATLICGTGPGIAVIAASGVYAWYVFFEPHHGANSDATAILSIGMFAVLTGLMVFVVHILNRLVERLTAEQTRSEALLQDSALSELQLEQLNIELRHRLKNTFAVINGLISQSARYSLDIPTFASSLSGRLTAMGTAMDIVATTHFQGASLTELVGRTLRPLIPPGKSRFLTDGPEVLVNGDVASALGLTLHELGTNAIKYGAWSNNLGQVAVTWSVQTLDDDEIRLDLEWGERGGPMVSAPSRKGLGTALIDSGFPSARIDRSFAHDGVRCRIVAVMKTSTTRKTRRHRELA